MSSSWWSCGGLVFSSRVSCLSGRVSLSSSWGYPAFLVACSLCARPAGLVEGLFWWGFNFGCTALPAMDSLTTGCQVPGTASPFPSLTWEDAAGASQTPAPVLHREGLFVGPLPTDDGQHVEPGERRHNFGTCPCGEPIISNGRRYTVHHLYPAKRENTGTNADWRALRSAA